MAAEQRTGGLSRKHVFMGVAFLLIFFTRFFPHPAAMSPSAMQVLGIFIGTLILWLSIGVHWPSALCLGALGFIPELNFSSILSGSIGSQIFTFLIFTFMCSYTLAKTPFVRRAAIWFISRKTARKNAWWFCALYFASMFCMALIMSPTVLFVAYLSISEEIFELLRLKKGDKLASMIMVGQTISCCLGSAATPIAHDGPILGLGLYEAATGESISYASYIGFGLPLAFLIFLLMLLVFRFLLKPDLSPLTGLDVAHLKETQEPMDRDEGIVLAVFLGVVALWVFPGLLKEVLPEASAYVSGLGLTMPPLLGVVLLCVLQGKNGKPLMDYNDALQNGVSWTCCIMAAAVLALSAALSNEEIGFTAFINSALQPVIAGLSPIPLIGLLLLWSGLLTNICSNLVTITLVISVGLPICMASGGVLNGAAMAALVSFMGAFAVATPSAQPLVSMGVGRGYVQLGMLIRYGYLLVVLAALLGILLGYPLASGLMADLI